MEGLGRPLAGVRVVDLTRLLPGPFATMVLGDLGADVIKVEGLDGGDYARYYQPFIGSMGALFASVNRNKRALSLDLKRPAGLEVLGRLLDGADVLIESFRPGVLARLGLDDATLASRWPRLVVCSISGYGQTGGARYAAGHDLNYIAQAGIAAGTGVASGDLAVPSVQLADVAGGALYAVSAVLAALVGRATSGRGARLDISMTEGALSLLLPHLGMLSAGGGLGGPARELLNGGVPCYAIYPTADGRHMALGALEPKFWLAFCKAAGFEHRASDGLLEGAAGAAVQAELRALFLARTQAAWIALLEGVDCCCVPVRRPEELRDDPLFVERDVFFTLEHPELGAMEQVATPLTPADRSAFLPPPLPGEHTDVVLGELGYEAAAIAALRAGGVVG